MSYSDTHFQANQVQARPMDRVIEDRTVGIEAPVVRAELRETLVVPRDHVRWAPIAAGTAAGISTMLVLSVLGLAIGASAFKPGVDTTDWLTWAGIWGAITVAIGFFVAGWFAWRVAT